ncbi:MAG: hypothetical protein AAGA23_12520 [Pseudomonadota bacterium]
MIFVVLVPSVVWIGLLLVTGLCFAHQVRRRVQLEGRTINLLLAVMALQGLAAAATAIATSVDPINWFACRSGSYGVWISLALAVAGFILLTMLYRTWPRTPGGAKHRLMPGAALWFAFSGFALLTHLRSLGLCTV